MQTYLQIERDKMKSIIIVLTFLFVVSPSFSQKKSESKITKEQATKTILEQFKDASIQESELEKENGKLIWSFDLKIGDAIKEVWVDANTGKIIKTEEESAAKEKKEQVSEKAEKAALKKVSGEIIKKEVKKDNGKTIYSFEIKKKDGKIVEVDVNAKTNKVLKVEAEDATKDEEKEDKD
jgi:uncharacterized membrane protein YkoI